MVWGRRLTGLSVHGRSGDWGLGYAGLLGMRVGNGDVDGGIGARGCVESDTDTWGLKRGQCELALNARLAAWRAFVAPRGEV